jgi:hypothetical protein
LYLWIEAAETEDMFLTDCATCGLRELRGPRSIELLINGAEGPALAYRCTRCDTVNVFHGHGHPAPAHAAAVRSAA